ncbi:hypothetical protein V491_07003 [Pseudogymnoascus sp. VKM F-3775]|nr:hypothetical protein V491_07003 [Pseudogymnoascus sp. VKM F-3775]
MRPFWLLTSLAAIFRPAAFADTAPFTYNRTDFLLHGKPYQMIGGQMDPQRIPSEYWRDRLSMARAMGLNTIFSYIFWNDLERSPGAWDFTGNNDIKKYFQIAQEEGLNIILRPGPYICGEREWGGFPAWLSEVPGMAVRTNNKPFLDASKAYLKHLAEEVAPLQVTNGGPILMVQVENEYGSFGNDHIYVAAMRDMLKAQYEVPLYTNDGGGESYLAGGQIHGVLAETDGDPKTGFEARDKFVTDPTSLGPQLDGEYYVTWIDTWGSNTTHHTNDGNAEALKKIQEDVAWVLTNRSSINIYMFHGGTNMGFQNAGLWIDNALAAITSSYDYGAPLDESGRPTEAYHAIRETIIEYLGDNSSVPDIPVKSPMIEIPTFQLKPSVALFDALPKPVIQKTPTHMEALGQSYGFIMYCHKVKTAIQGSLNPGDSPRDRVLIYVNGERVGVIDRIYMVPATVTLDLKAGDVLELLVENMGRIDYGPALVEQRKGIIGNVTVGGSVLQNWMTYPLALEQPPAPQAKYRGPAPSATSTPIFYSGSFDTETIGDTFLELPGWVKGIVWVNGVNLGRYWIIGPQQSLYLPGCYLKNKGNEITVLALEPLADAIGAVGISKRVWANNPDPDAP